MANEQKQPEKIVSKYQGKIFRTVKNFGPWKKADNENGGKPSVFNDAEFRRLYPLPEKTTGINRDTYHDDLIDRGIALGCIVIDPNATPTPTPIGPGNSYSGAENVIKDATAEVLAGKAARDAFRKTDVPRHDPKVADPKVEKHGGMVAV